MAEMYKQNWNCNVQVQFLYKSFEFSELDLSCCNSIESILLDAEIAALFVIL